VTALRPAALAVRELDDRDLPELRRLVDADPLVNAVLAARIARCGTVRSARLGGDVVGVGAAGELSAACYLGGNVLPVGGGPDEWRAVAAHVGSRPRACSSILGRADTIETLWPLLRPRWGAARLIRRSQPLLVTRRAANCAADPAVRVARIGDLERYLPAAAAMFTEELGTSPLQGAGRRTYRSRLAQLIANGRVFVRLDEHGQVIFKAEVGAVSPATCQLQGVWVRPDLRGRGIATGAMTTVIERALRLAPSVSLYVNDFNLPAQRLYARLGMQQAATLATVLF
jgi:uncharacterized protein